MLTQELEQQLLNLDPTEKRRLIQILSESLLPPLPASTQSSQPENLADFLQNSPFADALASGELDLTRDLSPIPDRVNL
jgi:hypothetical protein